MFLLTGLRPLRSAPCLFAFALGIAPSFSVRAEPVPSLDLRRFQPPTHPEGLSSLEPTSTPDRKEWNLGAWISYAYGTVEAQVPGGELIMPARHQLSLDLVGSIGLGNRISIGAALPTVIYQEGDALPESVDPSGEKAPKTAAGDLAAIARATLIPQGSLGGIGLAALARLSFPTGHRRSYLGEGHTTSELRLLFELGVLGSSVRATAGARVREEEQVFLGRTFGHDLPWGLGLVLKPQSFGLDRSGNYLAALNVHGAVALTPVFGGRAQSPLLLAAALRRTFGDGFVTLGAELPVAGTEVQPRVRAFVGVGIAPRTPDADQDGIGDEKDACAELAEDRDGFEDGDGCPDFDNDTDGVPDGDDRCPRELEDLDEHADEDGCPDVDDDRDGIADKSDACPREPGPPASKPERNGCPARDRDVDGVIDPEDRCPQRAEDRDGFEDGDGCPDLDDDGDQVPDREDTCPRVRGAARSDPALNGCPSPDRDGDTYDDTNDTCPDASETFDGVSDRDGCPETADGAKPRPPLAELRPARPASKVRFTLELRAPLEFATQGPEIRVSESSEPALRAIASLLNARPDMVLMIAVRPAGKTAEAEQQALTRSFAVVGALRALTHRDEVAETIGWAAVQRVPGAAQPSGLGFLVLVPFEAPAPAAGSTP